MVLNLRTPAPLGVQGLPPSHVWTRTVEACNSAGIKVPPPTILHDFGVIHDGALTEYQSAQSQLQKAQVTLERFDQACEGGAVPAIVSNAIKVPHLQLLKGTPDVATTDPDVVLAKTSTHEAIATARKDAIDLCRSTYVAQVIHCKSLVDPVQCADALSAALTDYGRSMINGAPIPGDVHVWDACILRLRNDYAAELTDISYDFVAKLHNEAREKASKANAVSTARAAAETSSAAKPIEDILKDNMQTYLKQHKARRRRRKKVEQREEGQRQSEADGAAGQRLRIDAKPPPPSHDVLSWVSPSGTGFHHHRPDTYPVPFHAAPLEVQTQFVLCKMTPLYYDTRLINRAFHNLSDVKLSPEQTKLLALNPKF
ncbi:hypothetical protein B0H16DRAFT_1328779, partial [Mycena metata]